MRWGHRRLAPAPCTLRAPPRPPAEIERGRHRPQSLALATFTSPYTCSQLLRPLTAPLRPSRTPDLPRHQSSPPTPVRGDSPQRHLAANGCLSHALAPAHLGQVSPHCMSAACVPVSCGGLCVTARSVGCTPLGVVGFDAGSAVVSSRTRPPFRRRTTWRAKTIVRTARVNTAQSRVNIFHWMLSGLTRSPLKLATMAHPAAPKH